MFLLDTSFRERENVFFPNLASKGYGSSLILRHNRVVMKLKHSQCVRVAVPANRDV